MTRALLPTIIFLGLTCVARADYKSAKAKNQSFCAKLQSPKWMQVQAGVPFPTPTPALWKILKENSLYTTYFLTCGVLATFNRNFDGDHRRDFEAATKRKITAEDLTKLSDQLGDIIHRDEDGPKLKAITGTRTDYGQYYSSKVGQLRTLAPKLLK